MSSSHASDTSTSSAGELNEEDDSLSFKPALYWIYTHISLSHYIHRKLSNGWDIIIWIHDQAPTHLSHRPHGPGKANNLAKFAKSQYAQCSPELRQPYLDTNPLSARNTGVPIILWCTNNLLLHDVKLLRWLYPMFLSHSQWHSCTEQEKKQVVLTVRASLILRPLVMQKDLGERDCLGLHTCMYWNDVDVCCYVCVSCLNAPPTQCTHVI